MAKAKAITGTGAQEKKDMHAPRVLSIRVKRVFINTKDVGPKAFIDLEFAGCLGQKGWRVIQKKDSDELFVSPQRTEGVNRLSGKKEYYDNFYGVTRDMRDAIQEACLDAYAEALAKV